MKIAGTAPDDALRERALAPDRSFLVQAPAGAGKTELLIQRYLRLLSLVDEPEEILAITFTRKAAAEMQRRICQALTGEGAAAADETASRRRQRELVAAVRARDQARGWGLAAYPSRLRISTIDSLSASLARSTPVSGGANVLRPVATPSMIILIIGAVATPSESAAYGSVGVILLAIVNTRPELAANTNWLGVKRRIP